ncbi:MAG: non-hydrolyzing UDP-N-acetylglucosamine 2-epimerase [Flavobacteriales bacterium]
MTKSILTIVGARPQIIKAAAFSRAIRKSSGTKIKEYLLHTGQHYDANMSRIFFEEMGIPQPDFQLSTGSGGHGRQTGSMLEAIENVLNDLRPDGLLVYGDTNSTLAGALAAAKMHIPVIHIEAGLRSFNKTMPEEINRICTDHTSTFLFAPTATAVKNLENEGLAFDSKKPVSIDNPLVKHTGDIMYDNSLYFASMAEEKSNILEKNELKKDSFILCTIHRDFNTDNEERLQNIFSGLNEVCSVSGIPLVLPLHPRTRNRIEQSGRINVHKNIRITEPVSFFDMIMLEKYCRMIITDSGGVQKEAYFFRKGCVVLRPETEWVEIMETGNGILADADPQKILEGYRHFTAGREMNYPSIYGNGKAAEDISKTIRKHL